MIYHWEWVSTEQVVLFEEGRQWKGSLPAFGAAAAVNKVGLHPGIGDRYTATGPLLDEARDFASFEDAMDALAAVVAAAGDSIADSQSSWS